MSDIHHEFISHASEDKAHSALNTKLIWKVFWILLGVTIFEVGISFSSIPHTILIWTFVALTLVKAYFIVGYFMHLRFEVVPLQWTILLPFILIVYLIILCLYEGVALGYLVY
ncbi:MAG: cytochrome C oxidase subunit IV family protein [Bacteroidia bacterium]|nr:cytochrome C oxidase subunit IV family protein [Bacteroidia bacterium]